MSGLLSLTAKRVIDSATFIKENTSGNKLKYNSEAGVTHRIFFPTFKDEDGNVGPNMLTALIHSWGNASTYDSCICTRGVKTEDGKFDGTCPVCERLNDAADIVKYIRAEKEANCTLVGEQRNKFLEELDKTVWQERKVSAAKYKYYVLLALLKTDKDGRALVDGDGPKFSIHIAAWTENTMKKFHDALKMQDEDENIGGREFKVMYGNYNDAMTRVGQAQVSVVDEKKAIVREDSAIYTEIMQAVKDFDLYKSVELSRPEVKEQTPAELRVSMNNLFREWDTYKAQLAVNPDAKYLEYATAAVAAADTASPKAPAGAIAEGAQAGTTGDEVDLDDLDEALGIS